MLEVLIVAAVAAVAVAVATIVQRRRPDAPVRSGFALPDQLDRRDFERPETPWLVAVFTAATCSTCASVTAKTQVLASDQVAVTEIEHEQRRDLHRRYRIEAVPSLVVADGTGAVRASFVGPVSATHLWATLAELRQPGSVPSGCEAATDEEAGRSGGRSGVGESG